MRSAFIGTLLLLIPGLSLAQENFIVTANDSILHGYLRFKQVDGVQVVQFTEDKNKPLRTYRLNELKYYSYKKDTIAILQDFYPFPEDTRPVDFMEAKLLISKGTLKLYYGTMPIISDELSVDAIVTGTGAPGIMIRRKPYETYIVKDAEGQLHGIRYDKDGFKESILGLVGDNAELAQQISSGKLKFSKTKEIIQRYNSGN